MQPIGGIDVAVVVDDARDAAVVMRLAAVAGVGAHVATEREAPDWWRGATAVVVDDVCAQRLAAARLPRQRRLLLVTSTAGVGDATWRDALALGADQVVALSDEAAVAQWLAAVAEPESTGRLLCCMSARGGAGASTLAAALGLAAAADGDALLLDGDLHGGGIDYLLGLESVSGARWPEVAGAHGLLPATALADALPAIGRLRVLSAGSVGPQQLTEAGLGSVIDAGLRGHRVVVADVGRGDTAVRVLTSYADVALLVVPCEVRAVVAASGLAREVASRCGDVRLVVRQGPGDLRPDDVASAVGAPVAAVWPWERRLDAVVDGGNFSRGWRRTRVAAIASRLLQETVG